MRRMILIALLALACYATVPPCLPAQFQYEDENGTQKCLQSCNGFTQIIQGKKYCKPTCDKPLYVLDYDNKLRKLECSKECNLFSYEDDLGFLRCSRRCPYYLSSDGTTCSDKCDKDELLTEVPNLSSIVPSYQCSASCEPAQYQYTNESGIKFCVDKCPKVIASNTKDCATKCADKEFLMIQTNICVKQCDPPLFQRTQQGILQCSQTCLDFVDDSDQCIQTCDSPKFQSDYSSDTFSKCSLACNSLSYTLTADGILRCREYCPPNQYPILVEKGQSYCEKKAKCSQNISSYGQRCTEKCDSSMLEYPFAFNGYKQCIQCEKVVYDPIMLTCKDKCEQNEVYIISFKKCISKEQAQSLCDGKSLHLSSDGTFCSYLCDFEFFEKQTKSCVKQCSTNIPTYTYPIGLCSDSCSNYEAQTSNIDRLCVDNCYLTGQINPLDDKKCIKCNEDEFPLFYFKNMLCKKKSHFSFIEPFLTSIKSYILTKPSYTFPERNMFQEWTQYFTKVFQDQPKFIVKGESLLYPFFKLSLLFQNFQHQGDQSKAMYFGSKDNILITTQSVLDFYKFKNKININSILEQDPNALIEFNDDEFYETRYSIILLVLAKNPACTLPDCSSYPVVSLTPDQFLQGGTVRILQASSNTGTVNQGLSATYTLKDTTNLLKYICLSYNLSDLTAKPKMINTTIEADNKSITCLINGDVQLYFDTQCIFVDKSLCSNSKPEPQPNKDDKGQTIKESNSENEDGLSGGEIAGIIIGCIAFTIISITLIFCYIRKFRYSKLKVENANLPNEIESAEAFKTNAQVISNL